MKQATLPEHRRINERTAEAGRAPLGPHSRDALRYRSEGVCEDAIHHPQGLMSLHSLPHTHARARTRRARIVCSIDGTLVLASSSSMRHQRVR